MPRNVSFYGKSAAPLYGRQIERDYQTDPRRLMAESILQKGVGPVQSPTEGMLKALQQGVAGYFAGQARRDKESREGAANQGLMQALTAANAPASVAPAYEAVTPGSEQARMLAEQDAGMFSEADMASPAQSDFGLQRKGGGTTEALANALIAGAQANPDLSGMAQQAVMGNMQQQAAQRQAEIARAQQLADLDAKLERDKALRASPEWTAPKTPVPGRDVPLPANVQEQKMALAEAKAKQQADARVEAEAAARASKPMPASALKLQDDLIEKVGLAKGISADMGGIKKMLDSGSIELGLFDNWLSAGKNYVGMSDAQSRNYATFNSTLEKMRNDSLRLNNGVQTEGDAQRAWNELFANINDQEYVKQRLSEIQTINQRAEDLQKYKIDVIRREFGKGPLEQMPSFQSAPGSGGPISIKTDAEYEALPSGTVFTGPDGKRRTKP